MDHTEETQSVPKNDVAERCTAIAPDADDETAVAGNQQTEGQIIPNDDIVDNSIAADQGAVQAQGKADSTPLSTISTTETETEPIVKQEDGDTAKPAKAAVATNGDANRKTSAFRQLVKSWETYIADANSADAFQPMQVLQSLGMCGTGHDFPRLTLAPSTEFANTAEGKDPFEPIILRHIHSTPLQYRPSFFDDSSSNSNAMPPPSQLDSTRRSSSTPSRGSAFQQFSGRSSFGTHLHSASNLSGVGGRSAFGFPLHRSSFSGVSTESNIRSSAFNPINFSLSPTEEEEPALQGEESTSIEVTDLGRAVVDAKPATIDEAEEQGEVEVQLDVEASDFDQAKPKKSAAARAARFLSDVGVLRRKKKGARSSIVSVISCDNGNTNTQAEAEAAGDDSEYALNRELTLNKSQGSESQDGNGNEGSTMYQQLDSDVDEEWDRYQSIENTGQDSEDSPRTVPSPDYQPMEDDRVNLDSSGQETIDNKDSGRPDVRIQVSCTVSRVPPIAERIAHLTNDATSPCPSGSPSSSSHSPGGTTRSSATTNTSGHTTQATSTTSATGTTSHISETDREVMEAIKEGKRRRRQEKLPEDDKNDADGNVTLNSSSSSSSTTNGYVALSGSPGPLRDGASVVADRFFRNSQSPVPHGGYPTSSSSVGITNSVPVIYSGAHARARAHTLPRKGYNNCSPTLSSSLNSVDENPPTFVSYLDRQAASDLTSLRGPPEAASCRGDMDEREDSPAQIVGYPAAFIVEANSAEGQENAMSVLPKLVIPAANLYNMLDNFRSKPPRSPTKGMRTMTPTTPPPRIGSPAYHHSSPPRNIVDYSIESNVSRPYVVRTNPSTQKLVLVSPGSHHVRPITPLVCVPVGSPSYSPNQNRLATWPEQPSPYGNMGTTGTYEEHNIEILKTDSRDEFLGQRIATPELDAGVN